MAGVCPLLEHKRQPLARQLRQLLQASVQTLSGKIAIGVWHDEFQIQIRIGGFAEFQVIDDTGHGG